MNSASISTRFEHLQINLGEIIFPKYLLYTFLGSFFLHLIVVMLFINQPIALDDMFQYDMLARSLKEGNGFRWYSKADVEILRPYYSQFLDIDNLAFTEEGLQTAFRAPGYPFFLALLYSFVPDSFRFILIRVAHAALAAILAPATAFLGYQVGLPRKASLLSAIGVSLYPILLFYPIGLASENLYILLGMLSVVSIFLSTKKKSMGWVILAGSLCGLTMFTRSIFAISVLISVVWLCFFHPRRLKAGLIFFVISFGICIPWSLRNSSIMRQPTFVENSAGYNLFIGYHPEGDGGFVSRIAIIPMNILDDGERDRYCMQQAIEFIRQNPMEAARRIWVRLVKFIGPEDREFFYFYSNNLVGPIPQPWLALLYSLLVIPWASTLTFGTMGLWHRRENNIVPLIVLFLLGYGLPHFFIIAEPRFHLAWVPVLIPFAADGWLARNEILRDFFHNKVKPMLIIIISLFIISFISGFVSNFSKLISIMSNGGNNLSFPY